MHCLVELSYSLLKPRAKLLRKEHKMATLHPSERELAHIRKHAEAGDESAKDYLELLDACTQVLETSNGISLARGLIGEHDDVYGHAIDDALAELMPVIYKIAAGGWEGLKWYVPNQEGA